jgi:hypothetical protein
MSNLHSRFCEQGRDVCAALPRGLNGDFQTFDWQPHQFYAAMLAGALTEPSDTMRNTVITFNYDTSLEDALSSVAIPFDYGFDWEDNAVQYVDKICTRDCGFNVLKLHGSMNWSADGEDSVAVYKSYGRVREAKCRPLLVPPTWRKVFASGLGDVWDAAVLAIRNATRLVIVGFSLPATDLHFKYLVAAGLQDNISLRQVVFVNTDTPEPIQARLASIFRPELFDRGLVQMRGGTAKAFFCTKADVVHRAHMAAIGDINR